MLTPIPATTVNAGQSGVPLLLGNTMVAAAVVLYNESANLIWVQAGANVKPLAPWTADRFDVANSGASNGSVLVTAESISTAGSAPSSVIYGFAAAAGDVIPGTYPCPLVRVTNIGNGSIPVTATSAIKNDGNGPGTSIIESTPSDQATSAFALDNDGSGLWAILSAAVLRTVIDVVRGNSGSGKATIQIGDSGDLTITTFYGTLAASVTIPASQITGTLPAAQVGSGYPAADIATGTLVSGVDLTKLSSDGGALTSDGAGNLTCGTITGPDGFYVSSSNHVAVTGVDFSGTGSLGGHLYGHSAFTGTGTGTYTHGMSATPNFCGVTDNTTNSTTTVGIDSLGSTTVHVNIYGGSYAFVAAVTHK